MKAICMPVYNRLDYLKRTLQSLSQLDCSDYSIIFSLEYAAPDDVMKCCYDFRKCAHRIVLMQLHEKLGCDKNTFRAIDSVFSEPLLKKDGDNDICIYLEDDLEVSPGLINLANWYYELNDADYACICLESFTDRDGPKNELREFVGFNSHGLIINRRQYYKHFHKQWLDYSLSTAPNCIGWDHNINHYICGTKTKIIAPTHAYAHHIGEQGTYCVPELYARLGQDKIIVCDEAPNSFFIKKV